MCLHLSRIPDAASTYCTLFGLVRILQFIIDGLAQYIDNQRYQQNQEYKLENTHLAYRYIVKLY
jgi:hypothetical protein